MVTRVSEQLNTQNNSVSNQKIWGDVILNVKVYGAKGDGVADDTAAIQAAQAAALALGGGKVFFPPGRYMITGSNFLTVTSGSVIWEGIPGESILDFTQRTGYQNGDTQGLIRIAGSLGTAQSLTGNMSIGADQLNIASTTGLSLYDLLLITSNDNTQWPGDTIVPYVGQLSKVFRIDSATTLTADEKAYDNYNTADSAYIQKVTPIDPIYISGLTFIGQSTSGVSNPGGDIGLRIDYAQNVTIRNCHFKNIDRQQLVFNGCYNVIVDSCTFEHPPEASVDPAVQYQVRFSDGCAHGLVVNCQGKNGRHMVNTGHRSGAHGISRFIKVVGCTSVNTWHAGFSTHNSSEYVTFEDCTSINGAYGFNPRDRNMEINNCRAVNCVQGVFLSVRPQRITISNFTASGGDNGIYMADADLNSGFVTQDIVINGGYLFNHTASGIHLQNTTASTMVKGLHISGATLYNITGVGNNAAIRVNGKWSGQVVANTIHTVSNLGIRAEAGTKRLFIAKNHIDDTGNRSVSVATSTCEDTIVTDNVFSDYTTAATTDSGTRTVFSGNVDLTGAI